MVAHVSQWFRSCRHMALNSIPAAYSHLVCTPGCSRAHNQHPSAPPPSPTLPAPGATFGLLNIVTRAMGGLASDLAAHYYGMRGRLWVLWVSLVATGGLCLVLGLVYGQLGATVAVLLIFSFFCQAACGCVYGIVPFVVHRCSGLVQGVVASGGNVGSIVTQALFFGFFEFTTYQVGGPL